MSLERDFQRKVIKEIGKRLPGSRVLKNDPNYIQGIPDLHGGDRIYIPFCIRIDGPPLRSRRVLTLSISRIRMTTWLR